MTTNTNETHPNYPFMEASDVFFGVELEVIIPNRNWPFRVGGWSYSTGTQIPGFPTGWVACSDSSISSRNGQTPVEIVSPKLKGMDGLAQLVQVLDDLNERGATVNFSTGLHIHVDGRDLDVRDVKKVKQMYTQYEKLFFGVMGQKAQSRYNNTYCKPSDKWSNSNMSNETNDKYRSLNLKNWHSYNDKKSIEFRLFAGNLNPETVITYVMMCVGLVVRSRNCTRIHNFTKPATGLKDLCKKFVNIVLSKKTNQIVPDFTAPRGDSLYQVLYDNVPNSSVSL